ncbi:MAG: flagellar biosynthesis repressor FlbT [Rhizobiales bacterium]|nr:flagellar biosynthesis repressor FlbT [Hyphomicrobiales bacterium]
MLIHLKRNEKLYINGAVVRLDRRGTIQLLNDANFLMENHIMQPEEATTPLKQVYFLVQLMIMDPQNAHLMMELFKVNVAQLRQITNNAELSDAVETFEGKVLKGEYFESMKIIRQNFALENQIAAGASPAGASSKVAA